MDNIEEVTIVVENEETVDVSVKLENDFLRGEKGQKGDSNILTIGTVEKGEEAFAEIIGESPNQVLNLVLPKGDIGSRGLQGEQGIQGEKGEKGDTGPQGMQGPKGEKGDTGPRGLQGEKGERGDTGPQGLQGEKGKKGDVGPQGLQGEKGDKGDVGPKGEKGDTGDTGPQGMQGPKGEKGDTGPRGLQGEKGEKGDQGNGVPSGGTEGQVLTKKSEADGDAEWKDNVAVKNTSSTSETDTYSCEYINELNKGITLWEGESLAQVITLSDNPNNYKFFIVETSAGYTAIVPAKAGGSAIIGKSIIEDSMYCKYEVYLHINLYKNGGKQIQFSPTYVFKNGSYYTSAKITKIIGVK